MACPAGYGTVKVASPTSTSTDLKTPAEKYEKHVIFDTIQDPVELRKISEECIYLTGGQFAIMCQFAHPRLAEGSYKHSNFAYRMLNRLQTTARFLNAAVWGTKEEKEAIFSVIHRKHAEVVGEGYYADDPELHKWTAATLFVSLLVVHETFFGKVSEARKETWFREAGVYGTSLRMPPEMWPATMDEFWAYWNHNIATLEVTDYARSLAKDLLWPKGIPLWLRPTIPIARLLTTHWLPERLQREFQMVPSTFSTGMYHIVCGYTSILYPRLPKSLRYAPSKMYMKDLKKSVELIKKTGDWPRD